MKRGRGGATAAVPTRRQRPSTATIAPGGNLVPWLAETGPLAYRPEDPPPRDYYFQYGWVLPNVFADGVDRRRRHFWFGAATKQDARVIFEFWGAARSRPPHRIVERVGLVEEDRLTVPIAVYRTVGALGRPALLLIQHGSYQVVDPSDQPHVENGYLLLYRGVQKARRFRTETLGSSDTDARRTWRRYLGVQAHVLSDSFVRSIRSTTARGAARRRTSSTAHG